MAAKRGEAGRALNGKLGPVRVHWPTTVGYYGAVGAAVAVGIIEWPVGIFIAAVPVVKLLNDRTAPKQLRYFVDMFQGAAKPVGGDGDSMMELSGTVRGNARRAQRKSPVLPDPAPRARAGRPRSRRSSAQA
jgi:hypothetical protein